MSATFLLILRIGMAFALYTFLGWAILTIWRDIKRQDELLASRKIPQVIIRQQLEGREEPHTYNVPEMTIGRDQTCDVIVSDSTVSAKHARLTYHHGNWWVEDLHSRNGTYLNQELLITPAVITTGDELQLGQALLRIDIGGYKGENGNPDTLD